MAIYVQSRGYSPDFEYCWKDESPPYLSKVSSYIQNDSPSLVLARFGKDLFLLVTDLSSPEKKDFRDRSIRHSVAWVCDENNENEKTLRAIAYQVLKDRDDLTKQVDQLIQPDRKQGFTFVSSQFEDLSKSILRSFTLESSDNDPDNTIKIAKNSQALQIALALELQTSHLPPNYELLVVVTGIKSEDSLTQARIWRSLSNLVKSDSWKTVSNKKEDLLPKKSVMVISLILILVAIAIIILFFFAVS
jgi:hypothetical protein